MGKCHREISAVSKDSRLLADTDHVSLFVKDDSVVQTKVIVIEHMGQLFRESFHLIIAIIKINVEQFRKIAKHYVQQHRNLNSRAKCVVMRFLRNDHQNQISKYTLLKILDTV